MKKHNPYNTPTLGRIKPKHHFFHSLLKRHRTDTGLVEDRTSSVTIVRIIVGLLMLHLIIIGGVLLHGHMVKAGGGASASSTAAAPPMQTGAPTAPVTSSPEQAVLAPPPVLAPTTPVALTASAQTASANHITQATDMGAEDEAEEVTEDVAIAAVATSSPVYHMVATGDTWHSVAAQYAVNPAALQAANSSVSNGELTVGATIVVPVGKASVREGMATTTSTAVARSAAVTQKEKVYTVQRGETLSRISRKVKVPMKELMQLNGIKDANRINPGMKLRLSR